MPTDLQEKLQKDQEKQQRRQVKAMIGKHIIDSLGQPGNLHKVQVSRLWEGRYRVNVFVGPDATSVTVAHSYFLVADGEGNILSSTPPLRRVAPSLPLGGRKEPACANP